METELIQLNIVKYRLPDNVCKSKHAHRINYKNQHHGETAGEVRTSLEPLNSWDVAPVDT